MCPLIIIVIVSQHLCSYMGVSGAVIILETKIDILLIHQYPFLKILLMF